MYNLPRLRTLITIPKIPIELSIGDLTVTSDIARVSMVELNRIAIADFEKSRDYIIPADPTTILKIFPNNIRKGNIVGILLHMGRPVGGIIGAFTQNELSESKIVQQTFFYANLKGIKIVHAIWLTHRFLITCARESNCDLVISTCSSVDTSHKFNRILSLDGWTSQGYISIFKIEGDKDGS
jgi:hypothetical protein